MIKNIFCNHYVVVVKWEITKEDLIAEDGKFPLERELRIMDIEKIIMEERMEAAKRDMEQMNLRAKAIRETAEKTKLFNF